MVTIEMIVIVISGRIRESDERFYMTFNGSIVKFAYLMANKIHRFEKLLKVDVDTSQ